METAPLMAPNGTGKTPPSAPLGSPPWERRARSACHLALQAVAVCTLAVLLAAPAAGASRASTGVVGHPSPARIADGPLAITDASLRRLQLSPDSFWGGTYTASTGEHVTIFTSKSYPVDDSASQRWADFLASLVHGPELETVAVYFETPSEVAETCGGTGVLGCYGHGRIIAPPVDSSGVSAEAILTHEYGHHVANNRVNTPWPAIDWGTKRWSTYLQVCALTNAHKLFPGAETSLEYQFNPGEVFAEDYRVLNEQRLGLPVAPWAVVDSSLQPDQEALTLLQQDVLTPWTANGTTRFSGRFTARGSSVRTYGVPDALDGSFGVNVKTSAHVRVQIINAGRVVARGGKSARTVICGGSRNYAVRIMRTSGSGAFVLSVSKP
jgi:hypothetical protein